MATTRDIRVRGGSLAKAQVCDGVVRVPVLFVNAYLVGERGGPWALVDTGLPGFAGRVRNEARLRFGDRRPEAIVLTHGHFDHAGNVAALAEDWDVPVYAHPLELPYLTGRSDYPPQDPTVGGALGLMSRTFPTRGMDLGARVRALPDDGSVPGMPGWRWLHTPGHTHGHVSLWRDRDAVLLAGDALATLDQDSWLSTVTQEAELSVPPAPFTTDWGAGRRSVELLAWLRPHVIAAGHGRPVRGFAVADDLARFAATFEPPRRGRYVPEPALADENGVLYVPPPVHDPLPARVAVAAGAALAVLALTRRGRHDSLRDR